MSAPFFVLAGRFYGLPGSAELEDNAIPDSGNYAYAKDKTLGDFFPNNPNSAYKWNYIGEPFYLSGSNTTFALNDNGSWSFTLTGSLDDKEFISMMGRLRPSQADRPRAFCVFQIISEAEQETPDLENPFAAGLVDSDNGYPGYLSDTADRPGWATRGMSGPIISVKYRIQRGNTVEFFIRGTDWIWALQRTVHARDVNTRAEDGTIEFRKLVSDLLERNAQYDVDVLAEAEFGTDALLLKKEFQISVDASAGAGGVPANVDDLDTRVKTPVGIWGVVTCVTEAAKRHLAANNVTSSLFSTPAGQKNMLQTFQRLAERTGLVFKAIGPWIVWDAPGDEELPKLTWSFNRDFIMPDFEDELPEATSVLSRHTDYRRVWAVHSSAPHLVRALGYIQSSNISVAPKAPSAADEARLLPDVPSADVVAFFDKSIAEDMRAQNSALMLALADNLHGTCQPLWGDFTKFMIDFDLSDAIEVQVGEDVGLWSHRAGIGSLNARRGLLVREVNLVFNAKSWGCTVGFAAKADVAPMMLPYAPEKPKARKKIKRETTTVQSAGDGTGGVFTGIGIADPADDTGGDEPRPTGVTGGVVDTPQDLVDAQSKTRPRYESAVEDPPDYDYKSAKETPPDYDYKSANGDKNVGQANRFALHARNSRMGVDKNIGQANRFALHARNSRRGVDRNIARNNYMLMHARNQHRGFPNSARSNRERRRYRQEQQRAQTNRFSQHASNARRGRGYSPYDAGAETVPGAGEPGPSQADRMAAARRLGLR